jgi:hypothetical protein
MSRNLFLKIMQGVRDYTSYFQFKADATGKLGFTPYQKYYVTIYMLAYRVAGDLIDECLWMSETTCLQSMYRFCKVVIAVFNEVYLREPNVDDSARLL